MSESAPNSPEKFHQPQNNSEINNAKNPEKLKDLMQNNEHHAAKHIEQIRSTAKQESISGKEHSHAERHSSEPKTIINKQTKRITYERTLHRAQAHLSRNERTFSRLIHKPSVERISNIGAQTVARSSGLLSGAIIACVGTIGLIWVSNRYGIKYSYFMMIGLFICGYVFGLLLEALWRMFRPWKRKY